MFDVIVDGTSVTFAPERVIITGFTGRNTEDVQKHIDELVDLGISRPDSLPTTYPVSPRSVVTDPDEIQVVGERTSGEAEFGLFVTGDEIYVVAASDHTDRALEESDVWKSKAITPSVISRRGWRLSDVTEHWDEIELRARTTTETETVRYQEGSVSEILPPNRLIESVQEAHGDLRSGTLLLSGTISTTTNELIYGSHFVVELRDPVRDRTLTVSYDVNAL